MFVVKSSLKNRAFEVDLSTEEGEARSNGIMERMRDELRKGDNAAICAPLIGEDARMISLKFSNGDIRTFINPVVSLTEGTFVSREKQLYVSDDEYLIVRAKRVQVMYQTPTGKRDECAFEGAAGVMMQQMIDVLNGVLLEDVGLIVLKGFDALDAEAKKNIIDMYIESMRKRYAIAKRKLDEDVGLKNVDKAIEFSQKYMAGMIETIPLTEEEIESIERNRANEGNIRVQSDEKVRKTA